MAVWTFFRWVVKQQLGQAFVAAIGDGAGVENGGGQLFVALQFTGNYFGGHKSLVHRLVRQHGLAEQIREALSMFAPSGTEPALIGGLAVVAHQVVRTTKDVDFLVEAEAADKVHVALLDLG